MPGLTRIETESAARHAGWLLARTGFFTWTGVHLVGLHDPVQQVRRDQLAEDVTGTELEDAIEDFFATDTDDDGDGDESRGRDRP